jgi:hypothetical protein
MPRHLRKCQNYDITANKYTIHFSIDGRNMQAPFIVTKEATSNIIRMNVIRTYKLKMDMLTTRVTAALDNVESLQTSEE